MRFAPAQVLPLAATTQSTLLFDGAAILHGWGWRETTDTTRCELELRDGASGPLIVPVTLTAGQSTRDWLSGPGIYARTGLYVAMLMGTVQASLWITPVLDGRHVEPFDVRDALDMLVETIWSGRSSEY